MRVALLVGLAWLLATGTVAADPIRLAANERLAEQFVASRMLKNIYAKLDMQVQVEPMPAARSNLEATQGLRDGEVARIAAYGVRNPGLIRVATPYYFLTSRAFWLKPRNATIQSRSDLKHYSVGVIRGVAHSEELTEGHPSLTLTKEPLQMFRMLLAGRFEVALDTGINGNYLQARHGWTAIEQSDDLARLDLYHYLHSRHAALAPKLDKIIRQMRTSGELEALRIQAENELLNTQLDHFTGLQP